MQILLVPGSRYPGALGGRGPDTPSTGDPGASLTWPRPMFDAMTNVARPAIVCSMIGSHRIEGYAIVSANGMIAGDDGVMPDMIRNDADQRFLQTEMDRAAVIVHGRHSHEGGSRAAKRKRIVVTRHTASVAPDHSHPNAVLWNAAGATLEQAIAALGIGGGPIAVIGGTEVFGLFLPLYDAFHLTSAANAVIPAG